MNIGIDIDDTITNTQEVIFAYAQQYTIEELKKDGKVNDISNVNTHKYIQALHNWTKADEEEFFRRYYQRICQETKPFTCSVEYLKKLKEKGHKIILITARFEFETFDIREETEKWLEKNEIPYDKLIINASTKKQASIENNVDVFIDDSFKNCTDVASAGIKVFIMDNQYNRGLTSPNIERVYSWPHIMQKINEIK